MFENEGRILLKKHAFECEQVRKNSKGLILCNCKSLSFLF